jgi:hypothetical protein
MMHTTQSPSDKRQIGFFQHPAFPTNVVTPYGTVEMNFPPLTGNEDGTLEEAEPAERLPSIPSGPMGVPEVTYGVTEPQMFDPETPKVTLEISEPLLFMATIAKLPFAGSLNAVTP